MNLFGGGGGRRKSLRLLPLTSGRYDRDEDLVLFRELHKKEKDRVVSLLEPVSDEFEPTGYYPTFKMKPAKGGGSGGHEYFLAESGKNDYDWLKTPPATPLFQSLDMEAIGPQLAAQQELRTTSQPLSRFSGDSVGSTAKTSSGTGNQKQKPPPRSVTPSERQKSVPELEARPPKVPLRSVTPSERRSVPVLGNKAGRWTPNSNEKTNEWNDDPSVRRPSTASNSARPKLSDQQQRNDDLIVRRPSTASNSARPKSRDQQRETPTFLAANLSKSLGPVDLKSRPLIRSTIPAAEITGFSDEAPPNLRAGRSTSALRTGRSSSSDQSSSTVRTGLSSSTVRTGQSSSPRRTGRSSSALRTDRSTSASRGRFAGNNQTPASVTNNHPQTESNPRVRSVSRGRKVETNQESTTPAADDRISIAQKGKTQAGIGGTQVQGSRMLDRLMSARKTNAEDREIQSKFRRSINEEPGFGKITSKSRLDSALKYTDVKREPANFLRTTSSATATAGRSYANHQQQTRSNLFKD